MLKHYSDKNRITKNTKDHSNQSFKHQITERKNGTKLNIKKIAVIIFRNGFNTSKCWLSVLVAFQKQKQKS